MVSVENRSLRIEESRKKILPPFRLDETLCLYSPQDNVDSLKHERISHWLNFVTRRYSPRLPKAPVRILLLMPCTKIKPYPFSTEHKRINQRLHDIGFRPVGKNFLPDEIRNLLEPEYAPEVLNLAPLSNGAGVVIHRVVISEPLAFVPYEHIASYEGRLSPSSAYDDPGLFENRGNAVSPWRKDFTAQRVSSARWKWGPSELKAYVQMHNVMAEKLAKAIERTVAAYTHRLAWVAPGLTHRSFVLGKEERSAHNVRTTRRAGSETLEFVGANDFLPDELKVEALPTLDHCQDAIARLAKRLRKPKSRIGGVYSRGGGDATPLALPELLDVLVKKIRNARKRLEPGERAQRTEPVALGKCAKSATRGLGNRRSLALCCDIDVQA